MQSLDIQGFSYEERHGFLPTLTSAFADCGGWILDRKTLSPSTMEFRIYWRQSTFNASGFVLGFVAGGVGR